MSANPDLRHENIDPAMLERIQRQIAALQEDPEVRVIYACESGSRAWGFPSADSDYDVRFLYLRPLTWYLALGDRRDVLEMEIDRDLDMGGWDAKKALTLLRRGNAPLIEWLDSPIVYLEDEALTAPIRGLIEPTLLPESVCHHYLAQTRRILRGMAETGTYKLKSYFYAIRGLLAARWIIEHGTSPPMNLWQLLDGTTPTFASRSELEDLAARKRKGSESGPIDPLETLDRGLHAEHDELAARIPKNRPYLSQELFDQAFLDLLDAAGILPADLRGGGLG